MESDIEVSFKDAGTATQVDLGILNKLIGDMPQQYNEEHKSKMNSLLPYLFVKFEKFSPRITQIVLKNKDGQYDSAGKDHLNDKI